MNLHLAQFPCVLNVYLTHVSHIGDFSCIIADNPQLQHFPHCIFGYLDFTSSYFFCQLYLASSFLLLCIIILRYPLMSFISVPIVRIFASFIVYYNLNLFISVFNSFYWIFDYKSFLLLYTIFSQLFSFLLY